MTAAAKDALVLTVRDLQPTDGTSTAIRAAFFRLKDRRLENDDELARLVSIRPSLLLSNSPEIDRTEEALRKRRIFSEQLDLLEKALRESFTTAKEAEEDAEYAARLSQTHAEEAAWNEDLRTKYTELAAALIELINRERAIIVAYSDAARMPGGQRVPHGDNPQYLSRGMQKAFSGPHDSPETFAARLHLPALHHGPALWRGDWPIWSGTNARR